jgi:hypothetical protein
MKGDVHGKKMGKYPKGALSQHKLLATGEPLRKVDTRDLGGECNLKGGMGKGGKISSSGDTGGGYKHTPPKTSRSTPA